MFCSYRRRQFCQETKCRRTDCSSASTANSLLSNPQQQWRTVQQPSSDGDSFPQWNQSSSRELALGKSKRVVAGSFWCLLALLIAFLLVNLIPPNRLAPVIGPGFPPPPPPQKHDVDSLEYGYITVHERTWIDKRYHSSMYNTYNVQWSRFTWRSSVKQKTDGPGWGEGVGIGPSTGSFHVKDDFFFFFFFWLVNLDVSCVGVGRNLPDSRSVHERWENGDR